MPSCRYLGKRRVRDLVWQEHIDHAAERLDIAAEELTAVIERQGWETQLFGLFFEDFATRPLRDGASFARTYLKRAGWREPARAQKYLESMTESRLRLYEIADVRRNKGLVLQDLLSTTPPIFVREKSLTHHVEHWDVIAARVVPLYDEQLLTGGLLMLQRDSAGNLIRELNESREPQNEDWISPSLTGKDLADRMPILVSRYWLAAAVERLERFADVSNSDGERLLFAESRVPLAAPAAEVAAKLDAAKDWERTGDEPASWSWLGGATEAVHRRTSGIQLTRTTQTARSCAVER